MACGFGDYISIVCDLWDSEELKIKSNYSSTLKATAERICNERSKVFEKCFEEVKTGIERQLRENKERPDFQSMYLYLVEVLPAILKKFPNHYNDPILWQVFIALRQAIYTHAILAAQTINQVYNQFN